MNLKTLDTNQRMLLLVCLFLILSSWIWQFRRTLTGDEPQYLLYAQSLLEDHDLDLANNYRNQTYRSFYPHQELGESVAHQSSGDHKYPAHSIGLSLLVLPGFALFGRFGAVATITAAAIFVLFITRRLAKLFAKGEKLPPSFYLLFLTVPFVAYSATIFTEMVATLLAYWFMTTLLSQKPGSAGFDITLGLALGFLYILHYKYAILIAFALLLLSWLTYTKKVSWQRFGRIFFPAGLLFLIQSWAFQMMYGSWLPYRGIYPIEPMELRHLLAGLPALFLDNTTGLLLYAPVFVLFPAGLWLLIKRDRRLGNVLLLFLLLIVLFNGLNAPLIGYAPAGRMLITALPIMMIGTSAAGRLVPGLFRLLLGWSLLNTLAMLAVPQLVYSTGEMNRLYWAVSQITQIDLSQAFPHLIGFIETGTNWPAWTSQSIGLTLFWLLFWLAGTIWLTRTTATKAHR